MQTYHSNGKEKHNMFIATFDNQKVSQTTFSKLTE